MRKKVCSNKTRNWLKPFASTPNPRLPWKPKDQFQRKKIFGKEPTWWNNQSEATSLKLKWYRSLAYIKSQTVWGRAWHRLTNAKGSSKLGWSIKSIRRTGTSPKLSGPREKITACWKMCFKIPKMRTPTLFTEHWKEL